MKHRKPPPRRSLYRHVTAVAGQAKPRDWRGLLYSLALVLLSHISTDTSMANQSRDQKAARDSLAQQHAAHDRALAERADSMAVRMNRIATRLAALEQQRAVYHPPARHRATIAQAWNGPDLPPEWYGQPLATIAPLPPEPSRRHGGINHLLNSLGSGLVRGLSAVLAGDGSTDGADDENE